MTNNNHPITPPPELVQQWVTNAHDIGAPPGTCPNTRKIIVPAINWGWQQRGAINEAELQKARDEELEACCEWLASETPEPYINALRSARRPKPPSLKEQALQALDLLKVDASTHGLGFDSSAIRRALESLPD